MLSRESCLHTVFHDMRQSILVSIMSLNYTAHNGPSRCIAACGVQTMMTSRQTNSYTVRQRVIRDLVSIYVV